MRASSTWPTVRSDAQADRGGGFDGNNDQIGGDQAGAGNGIVAGCSVDNDPVVEIPLAVYLLVQVFAWHGEDGEGLILTQRGPGVGGGLLVGIDEQDTATFLGQPEGHIQ